MKIKKAQKGREKDNRKRKTRNIISERERQRKKEQKEKFIERDNRKGNEEN